jgi:hypothetical protein
VQGNERLQVLFLRSSGLGDSDVQDLCDALSYDPEKPAAANKILKVLDLSSNPVTSHAAQIVAKMMEANRTLEYIGMAKCNLVSPDVIPIFEAIGRQPFPEEEVEAHLAKCKARDQIIEKNKKAKSSKKPEEPVPLLDNVEQVAQTDAEGNEVFHWVLLKNV